MNPKEKVRRLCEEFESKCFNKRHKQENNSENVIIYIEGNDIYTQRD